VQKHYQEIRQLGGEILVVSFASPAKVATFLDRHLQPFPVVSDLSGKAYQVFELPKTSWRRIFSPLFLAKYLALMFRGWMPGSNEGEDVLQLGGDFVLNGDRRLIFAYPSGDPIDRPAAESLVQAVRANVDARQFTAP
jgi:peroxiredoxin